MSEAVDAQPRVIAVVHDYHELLAAWRTWKDTNNWSYAQLDIVIGCADGYSGKIMGESNTRALSRESFGEFLEGLGLELVVQVNNAKLARIQALLNSRDEAERQQNQVRKPHASHAGTRMIRRVFKHISKKAGRARMQKLSKRKRVELARLAAHARWVKPSPYSLRARKAARKRWQKCRPMSLH